MASALTAQRASPLTPACSACRLGRPAWDLSEGVDAIFFSTREHFSTSDQSWLGKGAIPRPKPGGHPMKLYQIPLSPNCQKVVALAHEVGVPLELAMVEIFKGGARTPAMLAKNPNGKLPILEDG